MSPVFFFLFCLDDLKTQIEPAAWSFFDSISVRSRMFLIRWLAFYFVTENYREVVHFDRLIFMLLNSTFDALLFVACMQLHLCAFFVGLLWRSKCMQQLQCIEQFLFDHFDNDHYYETQVIIRSRCSPRRSLTLAVKNLLRKWANQRKQCMFFFMIAWIDAIERRKVKTRMAEQEERARRNNFGKFSTTRRLLVHQKYFVHDHLREILILPFIILTFCSAIFISELRQCYRPQMLFNNSVYSPLNVTFR